MWLEFALFWWDGIWLTREKEAQIAEWISKVFGGWDW